MRSSEAAAALLSSEGSIASGGYSQKQIRALRARAGVQNSVSNAQRPRNRNLVARNRLLQNQVARLREEERSLTRINRDTISKAVGSHHRHSTKIPANLMSAIDARIFQDLREAGLVTPSMDIRASPAYEEFYRQMGCPETLPAPLPVLMGGSSAAHKYSYVTGTSEVASVTVPPSTSMMIFCNPHSNTQPISYDVTNVATVYNWDKTDMSKDYTNTWSGGSWSYANPVSLLQAAATMKTVDWNIIPTGSPVHPPMTQLVAGCINFTAAVPLGGQAVLRIITEGDNPHVIGRGQETITYDAASNGPYLSGLPNEFRGHYRNVHGPTTGISPQDLFDKFGSFILMQGATPSAIQCGMIPIQPDTSFKNHGQLDPVDAPAAGYTSQLNNMAPRENVPFCVSKGALLVENKSTTDAMTIAFNYKGVYAQILEVGDGLKNVPQLASVARLTAPHAMRHDGASGSHLKSAKAVIANTWNGVQQKQMELAKSRYGRNVRPGHARSGLKVSPAQHSNSGKFELAEQAAAGAGGAYGLSKLSALTSAEESIVADTLATGSSSLIGSGAAAAAAGGGMEVLEDVALGALTLV